MHGYVKFQTGYPRAHSVLLIQQVRRQGTLQVYQAMTSLRVLLHGVLNSLSLCQQISCFVVLKKGVHVFFSM